jgi:hypothetical protein
MDRYNKLKRETLAVFAEANWMSPDEVAEDLNFLPQRSTWTYLKRLWRFGLLDRRSIGKGTLEYRILDELIAGRLLGFKCPDFFVELSVYIIPFATILDVNSNVGNIHLPV